MEMKGRRFEASTDCPNCGRVGVHWLRAPRTEPVSSGGLAVWMSLGLTPLQRADMVKPNPEAQYEVIRICTGCGQEWGQS